MYKLLALDMDGTLLTNKKFITEEVRQEINNLLKRDIKVTIATGRFPASVWLHGKSLNLTSPLVALNGAVILDPVNGDPIETSPFPSEVAKKIANFAQKNNVYAHFYGYNVLYVEKLNDMNKKWSIANVVMDEAKELTEANYKDQLAHFSLEEVGNLSNFVSETDHPPLFKATVIDEDTELIEKLYQEISQWPELSVTRTGKRRFDINAAGVSKKTALIDLCNRMELNREDVVAAGDYDNDAEMISWAGLGVAMENGNDFIKNMADDLTLSNEENGVAELIKKHF